MASDTFRKAIGVLVKAREKMRAKKAEIKRKPRGRIGRGEVEITQTEVGDLLKRSIDGLLVDEEDQLITLHIFHPHASRDKLIKNPSETIKFHFANCKTLDEMWTGGRYNRYVKSNRMDGTFSVCPRNELTKKWEEPIDVELEVCKNCLEAVAYKGYSFDMKYDSRQKIYEEFSIEKCLELCQGWIDSWIKINRIKIKRKPDFTPGTMPRGEGKNGYSKDWRNVSKEYREKAGWKCECCGVSMVGQTSLLDTHHKDGNRANNVEKNLAALCKLCHSRQMLHKPVSEDTEQQIWKIREDQSLDQHCRDCYS